MFPNLDAEQARNRMTNEETARELKLSRVSYEKKKKQGDLRQENVKSYVRYLKLVLNIYLKKRMKLKQG